MVGQEIDVRALMAENEHLRAELKEERRLKEYFSELIDRAQDESLIRLKKSSPAKAREMLGQYDTLIEQYKQRMAADATKIMRLEEALRVRAPKDDDNAAMHDLRLQLSSAVEQLRVQEKLNAEQGELLVSLGERVDEGKMFERQSNILAAESKRHLSEVEQCRTQLEACKRRLEDAQVEENRLKQENMRLKSSQEKGDKTLRERDDRFSRVADECQTLRDAHEDGRRKLESAAKEIDRLATEVHRRDVKIADLETNARGQEKRWARLDHTFDEFRQRVQKTFESEQDRRRREMDTLNKQHRSHTDKMAEQLRTEEVEKAALQANLAQMKFNLQLERDDRTVRYAEEPPDGVLSEQLEALHVRLSNVTQDRDDLQRQIDALKQEHRRVRRESEQELQKVRVSEEAAVRKARDQERLVSERTEELAESAKECKRLQMKLRQQVVEADDALRKAHEESQALRVETSAEIEKIRAQRDEQEQGRRNDKKRLEQTARDAEDAARQLREEVLCERKLREEDMLRHREELSTIHRKRSQLEMQLEDSTKKQRSQKAEKELLEVKCERLSKGIENIKSELRSTDAKLGEVARSREELRREARDSQLALEQERLEQNRVRRYVKDVEQDQEKFRASIAFYEGEIARLQEREHQHRPMLRIGDVNKPAGQRRRRKAAESRGPKGE